MAAFTSVQNGPKTDGATWGNTSPGVKGTDWPGLAGDTISCGHVVMYSDSETNELGQVTVTSGGMFYPDPAANTKLTLGHEDIRIQGSGQFGGGVANRVGAAYVAEIVWNTTADNAKGIYVENNGVLALYGDPTYYGSDAETALADDPDNTDGDTVIVTKQDMSALWNVGDELTLKVEDAGDITSRLDAIKLGTIQSMVGTAITLDITIAAATGVGNTWESPVVNVTRNVRLSKVAAFTDIGNYNTLRPRIYDVNANGNNNCVLDNVQVTGFHSVDSNYDFRFLDSVIRNCLYGFNAGTNHTISGSCSVYSNQYGFNAGISHTISCSVYSNQRGFNSGTNHTISCSVYSNQYGFFGGSNHTISGSCSVYSNQYGFSSGTNHTISCSVYSNQYGFNSGNHHVMSGALGYDIFGVSGPNTTSDIVSGTYTHIRLRGVRLPLGGLTVTSRGSAGEHGGIYSEDHEQIEGASYTYLARGDLIKNTTTVRSGGASSSIEVVPLSSVNDKDFIRIFEWVEFDVPASAQTRSVYFKGEGWTTFPIASELYFEAECLDAATGISKTTIASTAVLTDNTTWVEFPVSYTPAQAGKVRYRAYLKKYESACKIYGDNQLN